MQVRRRRVEVARAFKPLLAPNRHKIAKGGRGSGKSHFFAERAVERAADWPSVAGEGLRFFCTREVQKTLKESAKHLIETKIAKFGFGEADGFRVFADRIETPGDGLFLFQGMADHNAESVKSLEGFHGAWTEEAHTLSGRSVELLRPTLRWDAPRLGLASELWYSYNPRFPTDAVDAIFANPTQRPTSASVVHINWNDNPWFPEVLEQERLDCLKDNPEQYAHIWEGDYVKVVAGAYLARHLAEAQAAGRIGRVSREPTVELRAYWDIGVGDATAIWIVQFVGQSILVLDYYEAVGQPLEAHLNWLRDSGYENALCVLPHDGEHREKIFAIQYVQHVKNAGFRTKTVPHGGKGAAMRRVEAMRKVFSRCWFNEETTGPGRSALGWYHERIDDKRNVGLGPEHDWSSHGADAFGLVCIDHTPPVAPQQRARTTASSQGWMG